MAANAAIVVEHSERERGEGERQGVCRSGRVGPGQAVKDEDGDDGNGVKSPCAAGLLVTNGRWNADRQ